MKRKPEERESRSESRHIDVLKNLESNASSKDIKEIIKYPESYSYVVAAQKIGFYSDEPEQYEGTNFLKKNSSPS